MDKTNIDKPLQVPAGIDPDELNKTMIRIQMDIIEYMNGQYFIDERRHSRVTLRLCTLVEQELRYLEKTGCAFKGDTLQYDNN
tara:strand:- start:646 stop:894 length:249 start_codon:yes stop_codon:yes gene_type:complete